MKQGIVASHQLQNTWNDRNVNDELRILKGDKKSTSYF